MQQLDGRDHRTHGPGMHGRPARYDESVVQERCGQAVRPRRNWSGVRRSMSSKAISTPTQALSATRRGRRTWHARDPRISRRRSRSSAQRATHFEAPAGLRTTMFGLSTAESPAPRPELQVARPSSEGFVGSLGAANLRGLRSQEGAGGSLTPSAIYYTRPSPPSQVAVAWRKTPLLGAASTLVGNGGLGGFGEYPHFRAIHPTADVLGTNFRFAFVPEVAVRPLASERLKSTRAGSSTSECAIRTHDLEQTFASPFRAPVNRRSREPALVTHSGRVAPP